jgi:hypothetical protein
LDDEGVVVSPYTALRVRKLTVDQNGLLENIWERQQKKVRCEKQLAAGKWTLGLRRQA